MSIQLFPPGTKTALAAGALATSTLAPLVKRLFDRYVSKNNKRLYSELVGIEPNPGPKSKKQKMPQPPRNAPKIKNKNKNMIEPKSFVRRQSAPVTMSSSYNSNSFDVTGKAVPIADYDNRGSVRISGDGIIQQTISSAASGNTGWNTPSQNLFVAPTALFGVTDRLSSFEVVFDHFAFRRLWLRYIPNCSTTTALTVFLGYTREVDSLTTATLNNIMDYNPSVSFPAWGSGELKYEDFKGTKLFDTSSTGQSDSSEYRQGTLVCIVNPGSANLGVVGLVRASYVCDFYGTGPIRTGASRILKLFDTLSLSEKKVFMDAFQRKINHDVLLGPIETLSDGFEELELKAEEPPSPTKSSSSQSLKKNVSRTHHLLVKP